MAGETLIQIRKGRIEKVNKLRALGIDPYPAKSKKDIDNLEIIKNYDKYKGKIFVVAGRLMSFREHGGIIFGDIDDGTAQIQLYIKKDGLHSTDATSQTIGYDDLNLIDLGDFVEAKGVVTKTQRGEKSVLVTEFRILSKSIRPLPDKRVGLKNKEERFRRRYLEFATNPAARDIFVRKSKFWRRTRDFMEKKGFIEVETPILEFVTGGADASPFITHHNALNQDFYLRISSELYQKRLIGGGFNKIFTLGPNFRNEGIDDEHLQEYYQMEYYWAYSDIEDTIALTKELFAYLAKEVWGTTKFAKGKYNFDLASEWEVIDYVDVIKKEFNIDVFKSSLEDIYKVIVANGIDIEFVQNRNRLVDNLWKIIRKKVSGPASLVNVPKFISPLAKSYFGKEYITQRFQPIIAGSEIGNAYSELNDPIEQLNRFIDQQKLRDSGDDEAQMLDIDYVEMLEYGMPPTSSIGFSERLFWFLENLSAREGTLFPQMKYELDDVSLNVYKDIKKYLGLRAMTKFVIGKIVSIKKHTNADRLVVTIVDIGGANIQIVTGATNIKEGDIVPVALPGAVIPNKKDNHGDSIVIQSSKLRGIMSEGMMCSQDELGKGGDAEGIWILDENIYKEKIGSDFEF